MDKFSSFSEVTTYANEQLREWGLVDTGWSFNFNNSKSHLGICYHDKRRQIQVSRNHALESNKVDVVDTILHEIAHALHYMDYVERGMEATYNMRVRRGRRWVRKVKPHGNEWKEFARMVGATPQACAKNVTTLGESEDKWRLVIVLSDDIVEDSKYTCSRFLKNLSNRCMKSRKETLGKLFLVDNEEWKNCTDHTELTYYQRPPQHCWSAKSNSKLKIMF